MSYIAKKKKIWRTTKGLKKARVNRAQSIKNEKGNLPETQLVLEVWDIHYEKVFNDLEGF